MRPRISRFTLTCLASLGIAASASVNAVHAQDGRVGFIQFQESNLPDLLDSLTQHFPVATLEKVTLQNNIGDNGLDSVVDEMEAAVNSMKAQGIDRILIAATSAETGPFIEGSAGSLGGIHSDARHPGVIFSADRQGTTSVDNAQNWYRAGIDFVTDKVLGAPVLLPDVSGVVPQPQFILATDNSPGVDQANIPFTARAMEAGYEVVNVDLGWNEATATFDAFAGLGPAIAAAPPNSKVGLSASAAPAGDQQLARWVALTEQGLADADVFDPANANVDYLGMNYQPFRGDFADPGSIPVDVLGGVVPLSALVGDPRGVNQILLDLGFPNDVNDTFAYDQEVYDGSGVPVAAAFAWLATDGESNLDPRHLIDENRQLVEYYIEDFILPAGNDFNNPSFSNLRVNPRWTARIPEPSSIILCGMALVVLLGLRWRSGHSSNLLERRN